MPPPAAVQLIGRHIGGRRLNEQRAVARRRLIDGRVLADSRQPGRQKGNGRGGAVGLLGDAGARPRPKDRLSLVEADQRAEYLGVTRALCAHVLDSAELDSLVNGLRRDGAGLYLVAKQVAGLFPCLDNGTVGGSGTEPVRKIFRKGNRVRVVHRPVVALGRARTFCCAGVAVDKGGARAYCILSL